MSHPQPTTVIVKAEKNSAVGAGLAFCFGPLGLLYSSPKAALIMFGCYAFSGVMCFFLIGFPMLVACAFGSAYWGWKECEKYNATLHASVVPPQVRSAA